MKTRRFLIFSCLGFLVAVLAGCSGRSPGTYQGYVEGEYVYVASPLGGALAKLAVARGDTVKAGQLLFELERQSEAAALDQAEKNLAQAKASEDMAQSTYQRRKELRESPSAVVSAEELDKARTDHDTAVAQVASQSAALDKAQWSFDQKQQSAPTNAFVQDTLYRQGEWVAAGNPVIALLPPENLKVRFFVPQEALPRVKIGATAKVTFDGGGKTYAATINYISTQSEYTPPVIFSRETRANLVFMIEAKFSAADASDVRPGQPVDVTLQ
jgi:HlyD family secretion protein